MELEDLLYPAREKDYNNEFRKLIYQRKFPYAKTKHREISRTNPQSAKKEILINELLLQAINTSKQEKQEIINFINNKQYEELLKYLEQKLLTKNLSQTEEIITVLATDYLEILKTNKIPQQKNLYAESIFNLIYHKKYQEALKKKQRI